MATKAKAKETLDVVEAIKKYRRARMLGAVNYKRADHLMDEIRANIKVGEEIPLPGGKKAVLKDNFANTNKVWRSHGIARYELEIIEA